MGDMRFRSFEVFHDVLHRDFLVLNLDMGVSRIVFVRMRSIEGHEASSGWFVFLFLCVRTL